MNLDDVQIAGIINQILANSATVFDAKRVNSPPHRQNRYTLVTVSSVGELSDESFLCCRCVGSVTADHCDAAKEPW